MAQPASPTLLSNWGASLRLPFVMILLKRPIRTPGAFHIALWGLHVRLMIVEYFAVQSLGAGGRFNTIL
jgi:hypothetical protein